MTKNKGLLALTSAIILLPMLVGLLLWAKLPQTMVTHFGPSGLPDGFMSKAMVVFIMPLALLALHWLCVFAWKYGWKNAGGSKFSAVMLWIVPAVSLFTALVTYGYALNEKLNVARMAVVFVGAVFTVIGNYMPKIRRNFTTGIKLPWTLADEDNWNRTHRFAAPIWVAGGLVLLALGLAGIPSMIPVIIVGVAMVALPTGYSMILAKKKGGNGETDGE